MKSLHSTIMAAAVALSVAAPAFALEKTVLDKGPVTPSASDTLKAKPKEPSKKIIKKTYYPNGGLKSKTICTGSGQQHCD